MRAHVRAVGIEQKYLAALLAAIQRELLAEELHALRLIGDTSAVVHKNVPSGSYLPVRATYIYATGTTATDIVALY